MVRQVIQRPTEVGGGASRRPWVTFTPPEPEGQGQEHPLQFPARPTSIFRLAETP